MSPHELKWGILSTGRIAVAFAKDLLVDPQTRGVTDVKHKIAAVASRDVQKARSFIKENLDDDSSIKAYGSYQELYDDQV
jgi:predicted dehydrogenase